MKKTFLISHAFGPDNRGDHELLQKLIDLLFDKYGKDIKISIFSSFPEKSATVFANSQLIFYKSPISLAGKSKNSKSYFSLLLSVFRYLFFIIFNSKIFLNTNEVAKVHAIEQADAIFYCPGGYLYSNGLSYYANFFNGLLLSKSKSNIYFSPMSLGPFYSKFDKFLCEILLRSASKIFARESFSYNLVRDMGFENVFLSADLAWYNSPMETFELDFAWKGCYVVTVIDWDYKDIGDIKYHKQRYFNELVKSCKELYAVSGKKVVLYNQVGTGKGNSNDEILIRLLCEALPNEVSFDAEELTPVELKNRLHVCEGLIASRFHSALFAIQASTPFVALAYQPKAEFILKDLGLSHLCRGISSFDGFEVANYLVSLSTNRENFISDLTNAKLLSDKLVRQEFYNRIG